MARAAALALAALAVLALAVPAQAQTTYVSNIGQSENASTLVISTFDLGQGFTTGTDTAGYVLGSVDIRLGSVRDVESTGSDIPTVTIVQGTPTGTVVETLSKPASLAPNITADYTFKAPVNTTLSASTTYYVVMEGSNPNFFAARTNVDDEDSGGESGWSINNDGNWRNSGSSGSFSTAAPALMIKVKGPATNTAPTVATVIPDQTATAGTVFIFELPDDTFTDAESDTLTYTATKSDDSALPSWLFFDVDSATFSGLPLAANVETLSVKVTASDGALSASDTFDIVVSAGATTCDSPCLVSNIEQYRTAAQGFTVSDYAQKFTTGDNADGYTLTSIELDLGSSATATATPTVTLHSGSATGTVVSTLTGPPMLDVLEETFTFTPSSPPVTLGASTTYWVVAEGMAGVSWSSTSETSEDGTPTMGWGIGDTRETRPASSTGSFTAGSDSPLMLRVNGTLGTTTPTTSSDATLSALALENASDDSAITISPVFASGTTSYTASVLNGVDEITIDPTVNESNATVEYLDSSDTGIADANSGKTGQQVSLDEGANTIKVKVTAQDATTTNTYTVVVTRAAANNAPVFADATAARSFTETVGDAAVSTAGNVGAVVTATDADGDSLTYSLEGTDVAKFGIVSGSGQIRTKVGEKYDREAKASYSVTVKADDSNGGSDTIAVTITVDNAEEKPLAPAMPTVTATSGSTTSLDVSWAAPANTGRPAITGYKVQYRAGVSGNWITHPHTGTARTATIASLTAATSYQVQVLAVNSDGDGPFSGPGAGTTGTNTAATGAPTITGTAQVGETLTASTTGIADANGLTSPGPTRTSGFGRTARRPTLRARIRAPTSWSPPTWARPSRSR